MVAHKVRLLMTMLAVVLGVAFVAGTLLFTETLSKGLKDSSSKSFKDVSVAVRPADRDTSATTVSGQRRTGVPQKVYERLAGLPTVDAARGTVTGFTGVADQHNDLIGNGFINQGGNFAPGRNGADSRLHFTTGRGPGGPDEVALDAKTAEKGGYSLGDMVRVSVDGPVLTKKLTGVFTTEDGMVAAGGSLTLFDTATAQQLFLGRDLYQQVELKARPGTTQDQLRAQVDKALPTGSGLQAVTGKKLVDDQAAAVSSQTSEMNKVLLAFAGISLFVGIFLIANTFSMLVAQRTRELALLRAVGATRRQVTRSVLIEAGAVGAVSAVVGIVLGLGVAAGLRPLLNGAGARLPDNPLVITPGAIVISLLVGLGITVLAAFLPARRAAKIPPVAAMRSADAPQTPRRLVVRNIIGSAFAALGLLLIVVTVAGGPDNKGALLVGVGAVLTVCGVIVLTPLLSRPLIAAMEPVLRTFGVAGKLARKNSVRNPRRTAATATALMIGLALTSALTVVTTSLEDSMKKAATDGLQADYAIQMANFEPLAPSVVSEVGQVPGVSAVGGDSKVSLRIDGTARTVEATDGAAFRELFAVKTVRGDLGSLEKGEIAVSEEFAADENLKPGGVLKVGYPDGKQDRVRVGAVYAKNGLLPKLIISQELVGPHLFRAGYQTVYVKAGQGGAGDAVQDGIKKALGNSPMIRVNTQDQLFRDVNKQVNQLLYMVYGLLGMSVVIAVIGVVNTMALSVFERSREFGMLRAIGLDRAGVKRMIQLETLVISLLGALLGLAMGTFLAWAGGKVAQAAFEKYSMHMPWGSYGIFLVLALATGVLAALWPARQVARLNPLEAIKAE
ncbi:FtsX-like permease family protein [Streptomyces sp. NPDC050610]|uniref:ABC transporter permease n=1 Tax=Streptomyces sp. NPDC050610 TaxID=3157097 RepID=UPI00342E8AEF